MPLFSRDGSRIVTSGAMSMIPKVWDSQNGAELLTLKGHTGPVYSAMYSQDGKRMVTASKDGTAMVWDAETGVRVLTLKGHAEIKFSASFNSDGSRIITTAEDSKVRILDAKPINQEFVTQDARRS